MVSDLLATVVANAVLLISRFLPRGGARSVGEDRTVCALRGAT